MVLLRVQPRNIPENVGSPADAVGPAQLMARLRVKRELAELEGVRDNGIVGVAEQPFARLVAAREHAVAKPRHKAPQDPMQHGMLASRAVAVASHCHSTGAIRNDKLGEYHPAVAVHVADIEPPLVEGFAQSLEITQSIGLLVWQLRNRDPTCHGLVNLLRLTWPANKNSDLVPASDKLPRIREHDLADTVVDEIVYDHADVHHATSSQGSWSQSPIFSSKETGSILPKPAPLVNVSSPKKIFLWV